MGGGVCPRLGSVRLWRIPQKEAGRSVQAHAANLGATLTVTSCPKRPSAAQPQFVPLSCTRLLEAQHVREITPQVRSPPPPTASLDLHLYMQYANGHHPSDLHCQSGDTAHLPQVNCCGTCFHTYPT
ncbi:hypothetical protein ACN47E_007725 [Coniothyrium glycines]